MLDSLFYLLNTNNNIIILIINIHTGIYIIVETNRLQQKRQNEKRESKEELKQSTKCYKIYCGVEHLSAGYFKKAREYFQPSLRIVLIETIENR